MKVAEHIERNVIKGPLQEPLKKGSYLSNMVITGKKWSPKEIRLNIDLNKNIMDSHDPIDSLEDHRHLLRGSDTFTTFNANNLFFQCAIQKNKRKMFTFRTPWGLYRMNRLPMWVTVASADTNNELGWRGYKMTPTSMAKVQMARRREHGGTPGGC